MPNLPIGMCIQTLYSLTCIHLVLDHLLPLITGQPPEEHRENIRLDYLSIEVNVQTDLAA